MARTVCLIPGDGIGPEVTRATRQVVDAAGAELEWLELPAGAAAAEEHGDVLPQQTLEAIEQHRLALKGPLTTPIGKGFTSLTVRLRKHFNLYAAIRPVRSIPGLKTRFEDVEIIVIRENTEGLYSGLEHRVAPGIVESLKVVTERACTRIARHAFEHAERHGRRKVTAVHKANIMKLSDGLFLECARNVARDHRDVDYQEIIIDNCAMQLVTKPEQFEVLLMDNLYGDILSDLCAGLVGGLGVVPGANVGHRVAVFEAVHGTAPDIAGKGIANPLAVLLSAMLMLEYMGEVAVRDRIRRAVYDVLEEGRYLTGDLGGTSNTATFTDAIIDKL